ncbi:hypothetical protein [Promicromonospora sp. NPDC050880]|uniref:hypothetical protein n=1 Tax=Promicromonospora sp. NPDC050880 TaxID=3364406 RepID=UPI00379423B2
MTPTRRSAAAWAAAACATSLLAAGVAVVPAATAATDPGILLVDPVPTEVLASAGDLADLGTAVDAHLAGDTVFVEVSTPQGRRVYWRPVDDDTVAWSGTWGNRTLTGNLLAAENDALLLDVGSTRVLAWSRDGGGSRTLPDDAVLGQGAQYVAFTGEGYYGSPGPVTQLVTGGDQIPVKPANPSDGSLPDITSGFAIAGSTLYGVDVFEWPAASAWDAATGNPWPAVGGDPCDQPRDLDDLRIEDAHGRFALASCQDGVVGLTGDSAEVYRDVMLAVPMERTTTHPQLGDGVVVGVSTTRGDLLAAPTLGGAPGTLGEATAFDLNDAGTNVVLVDDTGDVRIARDLTPWSSTPATEIVDHAAPSVQVFPTPLEPATPETGRYETYVQARDVATPPFEESGVAETETDLRARIKLAGETDFGDPMPVPEGEPVEYPVGATVCWEGRAVDNAGNDSGWQGEKCEVVPDVTNQLVAEPLPPATDANQGRIFFYYKGMDDLYFAESDVRYRVYPRGETPPDWTLVEGNGGGWSRLYGADVPNGSFVCFQARGYDLNGTAGDWTPEECTFSDASEPRIRSLAYPRWTKPSQTRVVDGVRTADPVFTWAFYENFGIEGYLVQRNLSRTEVGAERPFWTTSTSYTRPLTEAGQHCFRVRAKDLAGHLSAWSGWRCSTMPVSSAKLDGMSFGPYHHRVWPGTGDLVTTRGYSGVAIYAKVTTGPRFGSMKVYMGSRFLGTVNAHAAEAGSKWVWLSPGEKLDGKVRFVANAGDFVDLREFYIAR